MRCAILTIAALSYGLILWGLPSAEAGQLDEKVQALEQKLDAIQETYLVNNQQVASALARSQAMSEEFSQIKGQMETNRHLISSQQDDLMRLLTELEHRIQAIEDRMAIFSSQISIALRKVSPEVAAEGDLYQKGLDLVGTSKYLEAAATFESFVKKYPKSQFVANAHFWIAECFYSARDLKRAIKEFQRFIKKYPRNDKVPEAILRQGDSFYELAMPEDARAFYQKVIQDYPGGTAAARAKEKIAMIDERKAEARKKPVSSYPLETIEQQRDRMKGKETEAQPQNEQTKKRRRRPPLRDF
jgi:tol-pal system protein YbgF